MCARAAALGACIHRRWHPQGAPNGSALAKRAPAEGNPKLLVPPSGATKGQQVQIFATSAGRRDVVLEPRQEARVATRRAAPAASVAPGLELAACLAVVVQQLLQRAPVAAPRRERRWGRCARHLSYTPGEVGRRNQDHLPDCMGPSTAHSTQLLLGINRSVLRSISPLSTFQVSQQFIAVAGYEACEAPSESRRSPTLPRAFSHAAPPAGSKASPAIHCCMKLATAASFKKFENPPLHCMSCCSSIDRFC